MQRLSADSVVGAQAAQIVPHVHWHIIPRTDGRVPELSAKSWTMFGRGQRDELDEEDGTKLSAAIRREIAKDLLSMANNDAQGRRLLGKL